MFDWYINDVLLNGCEGVSATERHWRALLHSFLCPSRAAARSLRYPPLTCYQSHPQSYLQSNPNQAIYETQIRLKFLPLLDTAWEGPARRERGFDPIYPRIRTQISSETPVDYAP